MKKAKLGILLGTFALALGVGIFVNHNSKAPEKTEGYTPVATYYSSVSGTGSTLLSNLSTRINQGYDNPSYKNDLKGIYATTDVRSDGKLYDIYSDHTNYEPGSNYASSYQDVGDGYNREHTIPKSWWGSDETKQGSDAIIVLPSDAKANGMRSNYPYGETTNGTEYKLSGDPSGNRLGISTSTQYVTGTVFEPFDSRKGDLARTYFYAATMFLTSGAGAGAAKNWTSGDGSKVFSPNGNNGFVQSYLNMLLKWHTQDPVSDWEIQRNNLVENAQGNRNPYIDHPSYVDLIWGGTYGANKQNGEDTSGSNARVVNGVIVTDGGGSSDPTVSSVSVSPANLSLDLTTTTSGTLTATVYGTNNPAQTVTWGSSNTNVATVSSSGVVTAVAAGSTTITATSTVDQTKSGTCSVTVSSGSGGGGGDSGTITIAVSDIPSTYATTSFTASGYSFGCKDIGNSYSSGAMQFKSGSGYLYNSTAISGVTSISVATNSAGTFSGTIWTGSSANPTSGTSYSITNGNTVQISGNPSYFTLKAVTVSGGAKCGAITITYSGGTKALSSIAVSTAPTKTVYNHGDYFDPTGLVITRAYSDSTHDTYTYAGHTSEFSFTPSTSTSLTPTDTSVTITYGGKSCSQSITVNKVLLYIYASTAPTKVDYATGECFDPTGLVITREYSDESSDTYTYAGHTSEFSFSPDLSTPLTLEDDYVTITYGGEECYQEITVAKVLASITVETAPTKTTYSYGEYFDPTGLVIRKTYTDSTSETLSYAGNSSEFTFSPSLETALTTSNTSVTISHDGKSCSQSITVNKTLASITLSGSYPTQFTVGDSFSSSGIVVTAHFNGGSDTNVTASATFSGYNMSTTGNQTVTVSYTYGGTTKTAQYTINVKQSGGGSGGQVVSASQRIVSKSDSTYYQAGAIYPTGTTTAGSAECDAFSISWNKNSGNNIAYTYNELRIYQSHTFTFTPSDGFTITSIVMTANSSTYATTFNNSSEVTNCSKSVSNSTITLTPTDGTSALGFTNDAQVRINYIVVNYEYESATPVEPELSSITLSGDYQTTFKVGDTFNHTGMTVTAHYTGGKADEDVTSSASFSGYNMSSGGYQTVTVSYEGKTVTYQISVLSLKGNSPYINGIAYQLYLNAQDAKDYYFIGSISSYRGATTNDGTSSSIVSVYFEEDGSGQNMFFFKEGVKNYLSIIQNGNFINFTFGDSTPSTKWIYDTDYGCLTFTLGSDLYTFGNYDTFNKIDAIKLNDPDSEHTYYRADYRTVAGEGSRSFGLLMNKYISCNAQGTSAPTFSGYSWAQFGLAFSKFCESDQLVFTNNTGSADNQQFVARYDYIVGKYHYTDFLSRNPANISGRIELNNTFGTSTITVMIVTISSLSFVFIGFVLFRRKRKHLDY